MFTPPTTQAMMVENGEDSDDGNFTSHPEIRIQSYFVFHMSLSEHSYFNCIWRTNSPKTIQSIQAFWTKAKKVNTPQGSTQNSLNFQLGANWHGPARKRRTDNGHHGALILLCWKRVEADAGEDFWGGDNINSRPPRASPI